MFYPCFFGPISQISVRFCNWQGSVSKLTLVLYQINSDDGLDTTLETNLLGMQRHLCLVAMEIDVQNATSQATKKTTCMPLPKKRPKGHLDINHQTVCSQGNSLYTQKFLESIEVSQTCLAQTCLLAWCHVRLFKKYLGHSWGLVYGERGAPGMVVWYLCTT